MCFLFLDPQNEIGPSISSSVVLCSFVLLVYIVTLVLVFCLCPSSVRVIATFPGTVLFPLLYSVLVLNLFIFIFFCLFPASSPTFTSFLQLTLIVLLILLVIYLSLSIFIFYPLPSFSLIIFPTFERNYR